jgi:putative glutamine amidotransferase
VDRLGEGLAAVAWAPDGVVEAVEMPGAPAFVLGVQWELHEEWQDDERTLGVWRVFADACGERMRAREARGDPAMRT